MARRGPALPRRAARVRLDPHEFAAIYRREAGRCTATLVRVLGNIDQAEDAVADAFAVAAAQPRRLDHHHGAQPGNRSPAPRICTSRPGAGSDDTARPRAGSPGRPR